MRADPLSRRYAAAAVPLAAVLVTDALPVDIRHASKIDRARLARWAERVLAGGPVRTAVKVLVTGASGMLGARSGAERSPSGATR